MRFTFLTYMNATCWEKKTTEQEKSSAEGGGQSGAWEDKGKQMDRVSHCQCRFKTQFATEWWRTMTLAAAKSDETNGRRIVIGGNECRNGVFLNWILVYWNRTHPASMAPAQHSLSVLPGCSHRCGWTSAPIAPNSQLLSVQTPQLSLHLVHLITTWLRSTANLT